MRTVRPNKKDSGEFSFTFPHEDGDGVQLAHTEQRIWTECLILLMKDSGDILVE